MLKKTFAILLILMLGAAACSKKPDGAQWVSGFRNVAKLATLEIQVHKIVNIEKQKRFLGITTGTASQVVSSRATVKIGIDLNELKPGDLEIKKDMIKLTLPPVKVVDLIYPPSQFELLESKSGFLASLTLAEIEKGYQDAETDIRMWLNNLGLQQTAEKRNIQFFTNFLRTLGYEREIYIDFAPADNPHMPLISYWREK